VAGTGGGVGGATGGGTGGSHGGTGGGSGDGGGQPIDAGMSCGDLALRYEDALPAARSCDVNANGQCQQLVSSSLSPCFFNCMTYVNDATILNSIKAIWEKAGCNSVVGILCPAVVCIKPQAGVCTSADGGGGSCSSTSGISLTPTGNP
jgi:hypothetical protein